MGVDIYTCTICKENLHSDYITYCNPEQLDQINRFIGEKLTEKEYYLKYDYCNNMFCDECFKNHNCKNIEKYYEELRKLEIKYF